MRRLSHDGFTIMGYQTVYHQTHGTKTLTHHVGKDIPIVAFQSPEKTTRGLHRLGCHIVNESQLESQIGLLELCFEVPETKIRTLRFVLVRNVLLVDV